MGKQQLYITVPSYFRCPISLDVMKSPVSLCTGVTYDRSSIQRWLDAGNNTCPATMQLLPSKDFVPNLTLLRLIQIWSSHSPHPTIESGSESGSASTRFFYSLSPSQAASIVDEISKSSSSSTNDERFDRFLKLLCFASESPENRKFLSKNDAFVELLVCRTTRFGVADGDKESDLVEAAVKILQQVARSCDDSEGKSKLRSVFLKPDPLSSAGRILRFARRDTRIAIADLIGNLASDSKCKIAVFDEEKILTELVNGLDPGPEQNSDLIDAFLTCVLSLSSPKRNKQRLVRAGVVRAVGKLLSRRETGAAATEASMKLLEGLLGCSEGRSAICEDRECISGVVGRLLRGSGAASESGVAVLWGACYWLRDQRAREAVAAANGLTRILLVMQSGCSPAAKRMCGDLLRIFRVNSKSCLAGYDTKTSHIMPF